MPTLKMFECKLLVSITATTVVVMTTVVTTTTVAMTLGGRGGGGRVSELMDGRGYAIFALDVVPKHLIFT